MTRTRTKAACHESAARDMMEREWGQTAELATQIAQHDLLIAKIDDIQASIARAEALIAGKEN